MLVPVAVAGNLAEIANAHFHLSLRDSLVLAAIGIGLFYAGHVLQQKGIPPRG